MTLTYLFNMIPQLRNTRQHRLASIANPQETETGLVVELAASSDVPYRRQFGYETLVHTPEAIDYTRVDAGSCPLLFNHKNDEYIGIVEKVWVADGQLRAVVRLSKNSDFARQVSADILDGVLKSISIGYEINEAVEGQKIDGVPQYLATKWTLYEVSVVTTPADYTKAGIGRNSPFTEDDEMEKKNLEAVMEMLTGLSDDEKETVMASLAQAEATPEVEVEVEAEGDVMEEEKEMEVVEGAVSQEEEQILETAPKAKSRSHKENTMSTQKNGSENGAENTNTLRLVELATKHERTADLKQWIAEGRKAEDIAMEILETKSNVKKVSGPAIHIKSSQKPDFAGAVKSWLGGNNSELAERGIDQARAAGRTVVPGTLYIPTDVAMIKSSMVRAGTAYGNTGANAVGKEFLTWEETLREGALLSRVGGQILSLNDVASMPYFSTATSATAGLAETGSVSEGAVEVGLRQWAPKRIAARYAFSNLLGRLNGTYDFEAELYNDLLAEGVRIFDSQIWGGAGTLEIGGLSRDTGITALNLSGSMTLASASAMITQVASQNGNVDNGVFVFEHSVYSQAFSTPSFGAGSGNSVLDVISSLNPVFRTGYLPEVIASRKTAMFGDFSKVTAATFGPVEIKRDDLTQLQTGKTILNMEMFADAVARQPGSLVRWTNISY